MKKDDGIRILLHRLIDAYRWRKIKVGDIVFIEEVFADRSGREQGPKAPSCRSGMAQAESRYAA